MAILLVLNSHNSLSLQLTQPHGPKPPAAAAAPCPRRGLSVANTSSISPQVHLHQLGVYTKSIGIRRRGASMVTRAGPSSTSYIFAFVFPLTLLAITIFTSMRVADNLDEKFLEEIAVNEAILEESENDGNDAISAEKAPAPARACNRPKREVEPSST